MNLPANNSAFRAKKLVLGLLHNCGAFNLVRLGSSGMARVLGYHNFCAVNDRRAGAVDTEALREQLEYLRRHFRVIRLTQLLDELKRGFLKPNTVAITIDDGRRNFYEFCLPLLKEYGFPATFFVVTSFINGDDWLWTDKLLWLSRERGRPDELARTQIDKTFHLLNRMRPADRNDRIQAFARSLNTSIPSTPPADYAPCSWSELREVIDSGLIEIGSHTVTHPILSSISDEESWREMTLSRALIEKNLGTSVSSIAFPNGTASDYRKSHLKLAREAGYHGAVVCGGRLVNAADDPFELSRIGIADWTDEVVFSKHLDGVHHVQSIVQRTFSLRSRKSAETRNSHFISPAAELDFKFPFPTQPPLRNP